jgi:hypothetical protein
VLGAERDQAEARGVEHRGCVARIGDAVAGRWRVAVRRSGATPGAAGRRRARRGGAGHDVRPIKARRKEGVPKSIAFLLATLSRRRPGADRRLAAIRKSLAGDHLKRRTSRPRMRRYPAGARRYPGARRHRAARAGMSDPAPMLPA